MKKCCIIFLSLFIITVTALGFLSVGGCAVQSVSAQEYLRIHIRADSNADEAQAVKYLVRDKVVEYLTPLVAEYKTKEQATAGVKSKVSQIEKVAGKVLQERGFSYEAKAKVTREKFPTRVYGDYTLPAGEYTALVIELGKGQGDNWWCVVYPPLCFSSPSGENVVYKSKIAEIIRGFGK